MKTGKHGRKEKTGSNENVKKEEKHTIWKATGAWQKDTQKTIEGHMIGQRSAKKRKSSKGRKRSYRTVGKRISGSETIKISTKNPRAEITSTETPTRSDNKERISRKLERRHGE